MKCNHCGSLNVIESVEKFSNNTIHIRGMCGDCHRFIKWVPYAESTLIKKMIVERIDK